jgi:hypothetical protein
MRLLLIEDAILPQLPEVKKVPVCLASRVST